MNERRRRRSQLPRSRLAIVSLAAAILVGGCSTVGAEGPPSGLPTDAPQPTIGPSPSLAVRTVSELLEGRAAGTLRGGPIAVHGYWSIRPVGLMCAAPPTPEPHPLEGARCGYGLWGITERDEPIFTVARPGRLIPAAGPSIIPHVEGDIERRLFTIRLHGDLYHRPIPIVAIGHFDDPGAALCRPEARTRCADRFVLDELVSFDPDSVPSPTPSPTPTPFPSPPPSPPFDAGSCYPDVPLRFVGWIRLNELNPEYPGSQYVYAAVTRDVIPLGDWYDDPRYKQTTRIWGRGICWAEAWEAGAIRFDIERGTAFREFKDGRREALP